jgi:hypothetical protein
VLGPFPPRPGRVPDQLQAVPECFTMTEASVSLAGDLTDDPEVRSTDSGIARSAVEVVAEELGPSLRWATATTTRTTRGRS